ncbi:unnamed protein product [Calypogeia fissa]
MSGGYSSTISFSKIRFRLENVHSEFQNLKGKEQLARDELERLIEKQKLSEAEQERDRAEFQGQLAAANDARHKLEETIREMSNEASASSVREQNLKTELKALLQSRNTVTEHLKAENHKLKQNLQEKTTELATAMDKLNRHMCLVEAIEKEANSVRRTVDEARQVLQAKEENLVRLESKFESFSGIDNRVGEKMKSLEQQRRDGLQSLSMKDRIIMGLKEKMELLQHDYRHQEMLRFFQQTIETKENTILKFKGSIKRLESQVQALEIVVERSQVVLRQQEDMLDKARNEITVLEGTTKKVQQQAENRTQSQRDGDHSAPATALVISSLEQESMLDKRGPCDETGPPIQEAPTGFLSYSKRHESHEWNAVTQPNVCNLGSKVFGESHGKHSLGSDGRVLSPTLELDAQLLMSSEKFRGQQFDELKDSTSRHVLDVPSTPTPPDCEEQIDNKRRRTSS